MTRELHPSDGTAGKPPAMHTSTRNKALLPMPVPVVFGCHVPLFISFQRGKDNKVKEAKKKEMKKKKGGGGNEDINTRRVLHTTRTAMNKHQVATNTVHRSHRRGTTVKQHQGPVHRMHVPTYGGRGTGPTRAHPRGQKPLGKPADRRASSRTGTPKAALPRPARLHRGPWQESPGAMETTRDRRAGTQCRRGAPVKQRGPAPRATGVRRTYRRLAGAIPPMVRDTPHGLAGRQSRRPMEGACCPTRGQVWGYLPIRHTCTGWLRHCLA